MNWALANVFAVAVQADSLQMHCRLAHTFGHKVTWDNRMDSLALPIR